MITYHLSDPQKEFLIAWFGKHQSRPPYGVFAKALRDIGKLSTASRPPVRAIPCAQVGPGSLVIPSARFNATKHLPPGWALSLSGEGSGRRQLYDLANAGKAMLTTLWNYWASSPQSPIHVTSVRLVKQLEANTLTL